MRLKTRSWVGAAIVVAAVAVLWQQFAGHTTPQNQPPLTHITAGGLDGLRTAFNDAAAGVRMIVLLSPT